MLSEQSVEIEIAEKLKVLGWENKKDINRNNSQEVIDWSLLKQQIELINNVNDDISNRVLIEIQKINDSLLVMNQQCWTMLNEGIKVFDEKEKITKNIKIISKYSSKNKYYFIRQFRVSNRETIRIPDLVLFINGLPLVIMEFKAPLVIEELKDAFLQNESLKRHSPHLWKFNVMNFISKRFTSFYGATFSSFKRLHKVNNLKTRDGEDIINFLFSYENIYKFITNFSYFANERNTIIKYMAAPHQIESVNRTINKLKITNNNKGGVIWHTQGSGKSLTMLMLSKAIINEFSYATILVVTDRNDLDDQLYSRFLNAKEYLRIEAVSVISRKDLITKLNNKKQFGLYFTTVQKFSEETGVLTNRDDIFILVDEAHRSQNNISGELEIIAEKKEVIYKYGFAYYMRSAFINAKLIAFTGTPLMKDDKNTIKIFGDYNHKYLMNDAVSDGTTVPIHYEVRKVNINLNEKYLEEMDQIQRQYAKTLDSQDISSQQKMETLLKSVGIKEVLEDRDVIHTKACDILKHLQKRSAVLHGKAMVVANSRKAAYRYYQSFIKIRPEIKDKIILVITENNQDDPLMAQCIVSKNDMLKVAEEFRKDNSKYKIAIVVDMWLTGFDVPDLDTLYIDKIIKWHNLMQAVARVNRVYEDKNTNISKESGLIVDYIGIWKYLSQALAQYTGKHNDDFDFSIEDINKAKEKLYETLDLLNDYYLKDIHNYFKLNEKEKYYSLINYYEKLLILDTTEKNNFILLTRNLKRFYKMSYSILKDSIICNVKAAIYVNALLTVKTINDDELQNTIELIKQAVKNSIDLKTSEVSISYSKISKNINDVSELLVLEAKELEKSFPRVSIEMMKNAIKSQLKSLESVRPMFVKTISTKLRDILNELQKTEDVEKVIEMLKVISKDVEFEKNKPLDFKEKQLQVFYDILSNDKYLKLHQNSQVLREIAQKLLKTIRNTGVEQFEYNPKVKSKIKTELIKLLKNDYNYPPEHLGGVSGILVNEITKQIIIDKEFFKGDE